MEPGPIARFLTHPFVLTVAGIGLLVWLGYRYGPWPVVIACVPVAAIICRPLINLGFLARESVREMVLLPEHGDWYAFRDTRMHVVEDDEGHRWMPIADVRKIVPLRISDAALARLHPGRCGAVGERRELHLRSDALVEYLSRSTDDVTLRFRTWIDRTVTEPARRRRVGHRD
jgi:hypothetical protein